MNVMPFYLPPLRERKEDIGPLVEFFVRKGWTGGRTAPELEEDVFDILQLPHVPRPIVLRELLVARALVLCDGKRLTLDDFTLRFTPTRRDAARQKGEDRQVLEVERAINSSAVEGTSPALLGPLGSPGVPW